MTVADYDNFTPDFSQIDDEKYHADEMAYHLKNFSACIKEALRHLSKFQMHRTELEGICHDKIS